MSKRIPVRVLKTEEPGSLDTIVPLSRVPCVDELVVVQACTWKVYEVIHVPSFWDEPKGPTRFAAVVKVMMGRTP